MRQGYFFFEIRYLAHVCGGTGHESDTDTEHVCSPPTARYIPAGLSNIEGYVP
jgi:hypothetical protein